MGLMMYSLYVKTHRRTGLKYLGYTSQDPYNYRGSGIRWSAHLRKHGNDVLTEVIEQCNTKEEVKELGIYYSNLWNVTESRNWANLQPEEGQGFASGIYHHSKRPGYVNGAKLPQARQKVKERMLALGDNHPSKTKEFKEGMSGNNNPAHLPHVKERMINNNPRKLPHNVEKWRKIFTENNLMSRPETVEKISGKNHYAYNPTIYKWKNCNTNERLEATRDEIVKKYNLNTGDLGRVIRGQRKHCKGWALDE